MSVRLIARFGIVCLVASLSTAQDAWAQDDGLLTHETFFEMETIRGPAIAPDGSQVVFSRGWVDQQTDRSRSNLWIVDADGTRVRELTHGDWSDSAPVWSPDGERIAFLSDRDETDQIHVMWLDTREVAQLTHLERAPSNLRWAPDGTQIARVIEIQHPGMIRGGVKNAEAIGAGMRRGIVELTGADDWQSAWRRFFEPGDVVGVKVNPVGNPLAISSHEVIAETIAGLRSAGVAPRDIIVFDRFRQEFIAAGFRNYLPDGVRWDGLTPTGDQSQLDIRGYDPDAYVELDLVHPNDDPLDDRTRRSHLGLIVTKQVNKIVSLPVLKDHGSAGITLALKNMSHGFVNNVSRSHGGPHYNACNQFIPQVISHPVIREKVVLHIIDGIKGVFQGGPFGRAENTRWTWERNSLFFATDPVAVDHIGWDIIDAHRETNGLPPVGSSGQLGFEDPENPEGFDIRQPQHVALAGAMGFGVFDKEQIDHREVRLV